MLRGNTRRLSALDPRQSGLHTLLGEADLHAGKLDDAEAEFRQELQLDSRYERAWLGLANLQLAKGQALDALASVSAVWQNSPEFFKSRTEFPSIDSRSGDGTGLRIATCWIRRRTGKAFSVVGSLCLDE